MFGSNFRDFVSQKQGQPSEVFNKSDSRDSGAEEEFEILEQEEIKERHHSEDSGNESQEDSEALGNENQEILNISHAKDLSLGNAMLANFPGDCDKLFIVESKDEDSYDIIPKNLTFAKTVNIFNQAVREDNCEELDKIVQNIEEYEGRSITLDTVNLKSFCRQQLNLNLQNNQHIYSNILSRYKFDQENFEYHYSVKELVLLAIAANDKLAEKYRDILFAEGNLSLLPLLVGSQKYIEVFIEKFHGIDGVYDKVKDQTIQFGELNKIGFFSVIALRKEQELLETVLVEHVLKDFEHVLKTSDPDPLYGVLETASLVKNEKFITIVLNAFERYINEPTKDVKDLLKRSFVTLLETAISQEHLPTIKYLCGRYINKKGYDIYEQAFADDRVIKVLNQQILKNIEARCRKEIYNLILKTALDAGNITFIEHLCKRHPECNNDVIDANRSAISVIKSDVLSENSESKSTDSQQPQENVDKGENIMNNEDASKEAVGNNFEEGKMLKSTETIEEKLSDAIFGLNYEKIRSLVEQVKQEDNSPKQIINEALRKANEMKVEKKGERSLSEIKKLLKKELENISIPPVDDSVKSMGAAASSQEVPVAERKESEPDSLSPSSEDDDFSKLEGNKSDDSAGTSSDSNSNSPFEEINKESHETRIPIIETVEPKATVSASEMPSVEIEGAESNNEQFDNLNDEKDNPAVSNSVNQDRSAQSPVHDSQRGTTHDEDFTVPSPSSNFASENLNTVISIDNNREKQSAECVEEMSNENTQPKPTLPTINKQSSESNQKTTALNTKKYVVAASVLAIAGIALGVAVAVYLEMLAVGVAVAAACCLIAATITYCYRPKSSLEDNEVEKFDKSTSYCR
ncbi:hypothetical protein wVul_1696 [Wolbachia endosymbiont of Armadillidium vulgare str. wVulC]|uniref:host RNA manipulator TomO n=1 Tax=Wolbachia endosymbiont of Armadillidium vulgare TaxID=77039 RepID=UPI0006D4C558|nr:hypothetical protein [Wolbachia endosymbiont of Armadillidium vulgare]KLT21951.1 hypothetical protein wVul_1696 [Wolbachia endosymbiont of Armadillidium vulgare str. wVulC]